LLAVDAGVAEPLVIVALCDVALDFVYLDFVTKMKRLVRVKI
jgi:hypothetical protein